jgi:hypothetical protein
MKITRPLQRAFLCPKQQKIAKIRNLQKNACSQAKNRYTICWVLDNNPSVLTVKPNQEINSENRAVRRCRSKKPQNQYTAFRNRRYRGCPL